VQHAWATAVEIVGTFTKQELKSGCGEQKWLEYFQSSGFILTEIEIESNKNKNNELLDFHKQRLQKLEKQLEVNRQLTNFIVTFDMLNELNIQKGYIILELDILNKNLKGMMFANSSLEEASTRYLEIERTKSSSDVVLVSTESLKDIQKGYPNYFADSKYYRDKLSEALSI
jgi:hypothetical protein